MCVLMEILAILFLILVRRLVFEKTERDFVVGR